MAGLVWFGLVFSMGEGRGGGRGKGKGIALSEMEEGGREGWMGEGGLCFVR